MLSRFRLPVSASRCSLVAPRLVTWKRLAAHDKPPHHYDEDEERNDPKDKANTGRQLQIGMALSVVFASILGFIVLDQTNLKKKRNRELESERNSWMEQRAFHKQLREQAHEHAQVVLPRGEVEKGLSRPTPDGLDFLIAATAHITQESNQQASVKVPNEPDVVDPPGQDAPRNDSVASVAPSLAVKVEDDDMTQGIVTVFTDEKIGPVGENASSTEESDEIIVLRNLGNPTEDSQ